MNARSDEAGLLRPGFAEPVLDAQRCFRTLLSAMAHPGRIHELPVAAEPPAGLMPASAALCLTLLDAESPLWLDSSLAGAEAASYLAFHCGCPLVEEGRRAAFALVAGGPPALARFAAGDDLAPEASTTVIWQVGALDEACPLRLTGPGIETEQHLGVTLSDGSALANDFLEEWADNGALYPCGIDLVVVSGGRLVGLPRTTRIERTKED